MTVEELAAALERMALRKYGSLYEYEREDIGAAATRLRALEQVRAAAAEMMLSWDKVKTGEPARMDFTALRAALGESTETP